MISDPGDNSVNSLISRKRLIDDGWLQKIDLVRAGWGVAADRFGCK